MTKLIGCECGFLTRGDTDEQVVAASRRTCAPTTPAILAGIDRSELFGWIEEG